MSMVFQHPEQAPQCAQRFVALALDVAQHKNLWPQPNPAPRTNPTARPQPPTPGRIIPRGSGTWD